MGYYIDGKFFIGDDEGLSIRFGRFEEFCVGGGVRGVWGRFLVWAAI